MEQATALFASINFLVIGLSHLFQPNAWRDFFIKLHGLGRVGALTNGFLSLFMGSIIVSFHNVWSGVPTLLTLLGWAFLAKAIVVFVRPDLGLRSMARLQAESSTVKVYVASAFLITAAVTLWVCIATGCYEPAA